MASNGEEKGVGLGTISAVSGSVEVTRCSWSRVVL